MADNEQEQNDLNALAELVQDRNKKSKKKKKKRKKDKQNEDEVVSTEVLEFSAQQFEEDDQQVSDREEVTSPSPQLEKKKKNPGIFKRVLGISDASSTKVLPGLGETPSEPIGQSEAPADRDVEPTSPRRGSLLETGDADLLVQNRRTSNEFYKVRKATGSGAGDPGAASDGGLIDDGETFELFL